MNIKVSKIVGVSNSNTWSQVHEFRPENAKSESSEPTNLESHGHLMAALSFKAKKEEIEVSSFGTEIIKRLQELYYSNESSGVLKKMSQTMESLAAEFLMEIDLEIVMMVVLEVEDTMILYAGRSGGGQVFLKRDNQLVKLINSEDRNLGVVSGKLKDGDSFVGGTSQFFEILKGDLMDLRVEDLVLAVHGYEKNSRSAAVVVGVENIKVRNSGTSESSEPFIFFTHIHEGYYTL